MSRIKDLLDKIGTPEQRARFAEKHQENEEAILMPFTPRKEYLPIDNTRYLLKYAQIASQVVKNEYQWGSEENKIKICKIALLFNSEIPFNKFLVLSGKHGSGKTTIFNVIGKMLYGRPQYFSMMESNRLNDYALTSGYMEGLKQYEPIRLCINDYGYEDAGGKHYGNEINPLEKLVYNRWEIYGQATFFTTNIQTKEEFLSKFKMQTRKRIEPNIIFVTLNENDFRSLNK